MRGIRIWHLAALALSVPLLTAAVPSGCTGGLNPNFREAIGQGAGSGVAIPQGYIVLGLFNETGWPAEIEATIVGRTQWTTNWTLGVGTMAAEARAWACPLDSITITGGTVFEINDDGEEEEQGISYAGGVLSGIRPGDPLECGTMIKVSLVWDYVDDQYEAWVELLK